MKNTLKSMFYLLLEIRKVCGLGFAQEFKSRILKSYFKVIFLKQYDAQNGTADILEYEIKFCTYKSLEFLFKEIFVRQEYHFLTDNKNPFIIDCGSNIGMSVLYFKILHPHAKILAFEPSPEAFFCLEKNVKTNGLENVEIHQKALSNTEGTIKFYSDQTNPGSLAMSTVQERMHGQVQSVEAVTLSKYIHSAVDFLKIDVEGAETDIIEDLCRENKMQYVKQVMIEYHHHIVKESDLLSRMLKLLEDVGFGYQIQGEMERPLKGQGFQDIRIYAYQKH